MGRKVFFICFFLLSLKNYILGKIFDHLIRWRSSNRATLHLRSRNERQGMYISTGHCKRNGLVLIARPWLSLQLIQSSAEGHLVNKTNCSTDLYAGVSVDVFWNQLDEFPGVVLLDLMVKFSSARSWVSFDKLAILRNFYMSLNFSLTYPLRNLSALSAQATVIHLLPGNPKSFSP